MAIEFLEEGLSLGREGEFREDLSQHLLVFKLCCLQLNITDIPKRHVLKGCLTLLPFSRVALYPACVCLGVVVCGGERGRGRFWLSSDGSGGLWACRAGRPGVPSVRQCTGQSPRGLATPH